MHRMIDLLSRFQRRDHPVRLNREFHLDLRWWHHFLSDWHGVSFWLFLGLVPEAEVEVSSDAAGSIGFGAYLKGYWFAGSWAPSQQQQSIAYKELFPVVIAAHVWGHMWCKRHVLFHYDNEAVVHILNTRTSKVPTIIVKSDGKVAFFTSSFLSPPPPAPGPMLIKTLMFVRVIVLLYPNIEQGGRGIFSKRENSLFSGLKWTTVKLYSLPNYFCL